MGDIKGLISKLKKLSKRKLSLNKKKYSENLNDFNYKKNLEKYLIAVKKLLLQGLLIFMLILESLVEKIKKHYYQVLIQL